MYNKVLLAGVFHRRDHKLLLQFGNFAEMTFKLELPAKADKTAFRTLPPFLHFLSNIPSPL